MSEDLATRIKNLNDSIGPKRIKTPDLEVEDHNLKDLMELERSTRPQAPVLFSNFAMTKVVPKGGCSCEELPG